jgi:hypothetical protein
MVKHQVNFVSGIIWSNVMLAVAPSAPRRNVHDGTNAGSHDLAGKGCNESFYDLVAEHQTPRQWVHAQGCGHQ